MINPDAIVGLSYDGVNLKSTKANGTLATSTSFYAPNHAGTAGQILLSSGEGLAPYWADTNAIWARGMADETQSNTAYIDRATTAAISLIQDSKLCWAIERTARNDNSLTAHFYNENGEWVVQSKLLSELNYTDFTVKKDGTGASGTWGINISGNAATASAVAWSRITGKPSTFTPSNHTHAYIQGGNGQLDIGIANRPVITTYYANTGNCSWGIEKHSGSSLSWHDFNDSTGEYLATRTLLDTSNYTTYISVASKYCTVNGYGTTNFPYHRIAYGTPGTGAWIDSHAILLISANYHGGAWGIIKIGHRTNDSGSSVGYSAEWLVRSGNMPVDAITIASYGKSVTNNVYFDVFYNVRDSGWPRMTVTALGPTIDITLVDSAEHSSTSATEAYASIAAAGTALHGQAYTSSGPSTQTAIYGAVWN